MPQSDDNHTFSVRPEEAGFSLMTNLEDEVCRAADGRQSRPAPALLRSGLLTNPAKYERAGFVNSLTVRPEEAGLRLDYFLRLRDRRLSQRACKRLCRNNLALINNKPGKPGQTLRADDLVLISQPTQPDITATLYSQVRIVQAQHGLYALKKPAGLHSVNLHGSGNPSLEECLRLRWPALWNDWNARLSAARTINPIEEAGAGRGCCALSSAPPLPTLPEPLNRLDQDTSGLVMAAGTLEARQRYLAAEETWRISKNYLALVHGTLEQPLTLTNTLRSLNKTRMRAREDADMNPLRHTHALPLAVITPGQLGRTPEKAPCTLVLARIAKGARHQIRVHLARAGYPIVGDALYGPASSASSDGPDEFQSANCSQGNTTPEQITANSGQLFLHHAFISLPGFTAALQPDWPERIWLGHWKEIVAARD